MARKPTKGRKRVLMAIVFADVAGFGRLTEVEVRRFAENVLAECVDHASSHNCRLVNTWGDAVVAYFVTVKDALEFCFDLRDLFRNRDWRSPAGGAFSTDLAVRISLHAGYVFLAKRSSVPGGQIYGTEISLAARIEPIVTPNEVFASASAERMLKVERVGRIQCRAMGTFTLPKEEKEERLYWIGREKDARPPKVLRKTPSMDLMCLRTTDESVDWVGQLKGPIRSIKLLVYNGGYSLHRLLDALRGKLAGRCDIRVMMYDPHVSALQAAPLVDGSARRYLSELRAAFTNEPALAATACEYLVLASEITAWGNDSQQSHVERFKDHVTEFIKHNPRSKINLCARLTPRLLPGRIWILDDHVLLMGFFQPKTLGPIACAERGHPLFDAVERHFDYVWTDAENRGPDSLIIRRDGAAMHPYTEQA